MLHNEAPFSPLLRLDHLSVFFKQGRRRLYAVSALSLSLYPKAIVALVGESGCGKSLTARAILRLPPQNAELLGHIYFGQDDILALSEKKVRALRGRRISMIFQEPQTALNPVLSVGDQAAEVLECHFSLPKRDCRTLVEEMFTQVGIPQAHDRYKSYPHELSGGMRQRVMIAMALLGKPDLLLADEPTTALDATIRQQILLLLLEQSAARGMAVLCISHDLGMVKDFAERVGVMYAGHLVEYAPVEELFAHPQHPYTQGLLQAAPPAMHKGTSPSRLKTIPGFVPSLQAIPEGCPFAPRCERAKPICRERFPDKQETATHSVFCHNP